MEGSTGGQCKIFIDFQVKMFFFLPFSLAFLAESVWFERSLPPAQVRCLPLNLMTSQAIQGTRYRTDGVGANGLKELTTKSATSASGQWSICIGMLSRSLHRSRDVCFGQREKLSSPVISFSLPFAFPFLTSACFCFVTGLIDWLCGYASHIGVIRYMKQLAKVEALRYQRHPTFRERSSG